ncbi:hypothetical protein Bra3105_18250 [Brachybacterium halotolerans subsp. kimchii]|uniref:hypothetical protein n=1 Tax=Brachybacterium halotolerans TaxID=2795215 RepID=UPI001E34CD6A|nr:hypothetical protein [Brachybacterium halotolerans]UEJ82740.1 hypothetical protein Bra3105_18250 [Brachybacterium halotolerans subsp. kimchii]
MTLHKTRPEPLVVVHDVLQWAWSALCRFGRRMPWTLVIAAFALTMLSPFLAVTFGEFARNARPEGLVFLGIICAVALLVVRIVSTYARRTRKEHWDLRHGPLQSGRIATAVSVPANLVTEYGEAVARAAREAAAPRADATVLRDLARDLAARSTPTQWQTLRRRAEHEAAHTVAAHELGAVITGVWATGSHVGQIGGTAQSSIAGLGATGVEHEWASAVGALAGTVWDQNHGITDQGGRNDLQMVAGLLTQILIWGERPPGFEGPMTYESLLAGLTTRTRQILADNDALVHAIADRIEAHPDEHLTEHDLADLWNKE